MLRETIHASIDTNVEREAAKLRARCEASGLDQLSAELLVGQTAEILSSLVIQGRRIAAAGSQMEATRELSGEGYLIRLVFNQGVQKGFLQRFVDRLRGA
jgi:hypothetical protein